MLRIENCRAGNDHHKWIWPTLPLVNIARAKDVGYYCLYQKGSNTVNSDAPIDGNPYFPRSLPSHQFSWLTTAYDNNALTSHPSNSPVHLAKPNRAVLLFGIEHKFYVARTAEEHISLRQKVIVGRWKGNKAKVPRIRNVRMLIWFFFLHVRIHHFNDHDTGKTEGQRRNSWDISGR